MPAVLSVAPTTTGVFTLPFLVTLAIAIVALVGIAVYLRRLRTAGNLTLANGSIGGASAALVLAGALLASVSLGVASPAVAENTNAITPVAPVYQPIVIEGLEGFQLPTE